MRKTLKRFLPNHESVHANRWLLLAGWLSRRQGGVADLADPRVAWTAGTAQRPPLITAPTQTKRPSSSRSVR